MRSLQVILATACCSLASVSTLANDTSNHSSDYGDRDNWLCHPSQSTNNNVCLRDQTLVSVAANGSRTYEAHYPAINPDVDCFYVYPTASMDLTASSDLNPDAQEEETTAIQFGRYSEVCRQFAPVYRQRTLTYLGVGALGDGLVSEETMAQANATAYDDVRNAFMTYLENDNDGRGFILVGHSQGARLLAKLVAEEIETDSTLADQLVSAHLVGTGITVPVGHVTGGTFQSTPLCQQPSDIGCVVAYSTFREGDPELETPRFGQTQLEGQEVACTNPATLSGGEETLDARIPFDQPYAFATLLKIKGSGGPYKRWWTNQKIQRDADYYAVPDQFRGECVRDTNGTHYLNVSIDADKNDPRADDYRGELIVVKGWGLHLVDMNVAQGNLIRLAHDQVQSWLSR
jgi:hypothetical protein